jgi:cell filamentation protein
MLEGQYQPGSHDKVLLNKLGIVDPDIMDDIELMLLYDLQTRLFDEVESDQRITANLLCDWHRIWLERVYEWAGSFRSVNMQKDGFPFAAAVQIPKLMQEFESKYLSRYTPCEGFDELRLIEALAVCHIEFIVIHPFREGNGRLARVLSTVMALQADQPPLDFTYLQESEDLYIAAIHAGHAGDYETMKRVFSEVLKNSRFVI